MGLRGPVQPLFRPRAADDLVALAEAEARTRLAILVQLLELGGKISVVPLRERMPQLGAALRRLLDLDSDVPQFSHALFNVPDPPDIPFACRAQRETPGSRAGLPRPQSRPRRRGRSPPQYAGLSGFRPANSRTVASPKRKPPMCAKKAIPPPDSGCSRAPPPARSWKRNQAPRNQTAGTSTKKKKTSVSTRARGSSRR